MPRKNKTSHSSLDGLPGADSVVQASSSARGTLRVKFSNTEAPEHITPQPLTSREMQARVQRKNAAYATTAGGFGMSRTAMGAYSSGDSSMGSGGNFYSPQLSTDFLEKPQNLRERRAWYRHFYNSSELVGAAIDLHSTIPLSKIRLLRPKCENSDYSQYIYDYFLDMCDNIHLFKRLQEISHEYNLFGNCHEPSTLIRTSDGFKRIMDVAIGDLVLTHEGRYQPVEATMSRAVDGGLEIATHYSYMTSKLTEEHPLEVLRGNSFTFVDAKDVREGDYLHMSCTRAVKDVDHFDFIKGFPLLCKTGTGYTKTVNISGKRFEESNRVRSLLLAWLSSLSAPTMATRSELCLKFECASSTLDSLVLQLNKELPVSFHKRIGSVGYQKGSSVQWFPVPKDVSGSSESSSYSITREESFSSPHTVSVDNDLMYLIGYWLGDGTIARDRSREGVWGRALWHITIGKGSEDQANKLRGILRKILRVERVPEHTGTDSYNLAISGNPDFVEWWSANFGETSFGSNAKKIPQWVLELPTDKLEHLLSGMLDSDGCIQERGVQLHLSSKNLLLSVRDISLKCGSFSSVTLVKPKRLNLANLPRAKSAFRREGYTLKSVGNADAWYTGSVKFAKKKLLGKAPQSTKAMHLINVGGKFAVKVKAVTVCPLEEVYNLQVAVDHTYQANLISTHNCLVFSEEHDPYPDGPTSEAGQIREHKGRERSKYLFDKFKIVDKDPNYQGWSKVTILPPDQVRIEKALFSDHPLIEYIPDPKTKEAILRDYSSDETYGNLSSGSMPKVPASIREAVGRGGAIPLDTDPDSGSHCCHMARKKSQYETMGVSILERCINTLLLKDKLRQAQTSIASRHMTPIRIVWADEQSDTDIDNLRAQVDLAMMDPDFSIISNYEIHWEEMGSQGRLLDLSNEYDHQDNDLYAGLGVTKELLTGEGMYSGAKISLEILNIQYMQFREMLQSWIEDNLFKPVARKKGFIEVDKFGREHLLYPKVSFTRLSIRDAGESFDQVFQLYQKGSVPIDVILEMLNIDPEIASQKLSEDLMTVNDAAFNDFLRAAYGAAGNDFAAKTDIVDRLATNMGLNIIKAPEEGAGGGDMGGGAGALRFATTKSVRAEDTQAQSDGPQAGGVGRVGPDSISNGIDIKKLSSDPRSKEALAYILKEATEKPERLVKLAELIAKHKQANGEA